MRAKIRRKVSTPAPPKPEIVFPSHTLVSGQKGDLRVSIPACLDYVKIVFEFDDELFSIIGSKRLLEKGTFECCRPAALGPWEAVFVVTVREVKFAFQEKTHLGSPSLWPVRLDGRSCTEPPDSGAI